MSWVHTQFLYSNWRCCVLLRSLHSPSLRSIWSRGCHTYTLFVHTGITWYLQQYTWRLWARQLLYLRHWYRPPLPGDCAASLPLCSSHSCSLALTFTAMSLHCFNCFDRMGCSCNQQRVPKPPLRIPPPWGSPPTCHGLPAL